MKKVIIVASFLLCLLSGANAATPEIKWPEYEFTTVKANPITSVKDQSRSGTCWCFAGTGMIESEIIRINNIKDTTLYPDLSEFYTISNSYYERAVKFVRLDGKLGFSSGSETFDVLDVVRDHGFVPNSVMTGMQYGTELPVQAELDAVLKAYVNTIVTNPNKTLTTAWKKGFQGILDAYLGEKPSTFTVDGKEFTPASYRDYLKFNPNDYVSFTSFTHHPFYTKFAVEVCDNWRGDEDYNVPIDTFLNILDAAINAGYTVAWGTDVSSPGFTRNGLGVNLDVEATNNAGSDQAHWVGEDNSDKPVVDVIVEKEATQEQRQIEFDNKTMTDDHGMLIFGIARDQFGKKYYMVKNSWGKTGKYNGIWYVTEQFVKANSIDIILHKNAVPKEVKAKLGIQ